MKMKIEDKQYYYKSKYVVSQLSQNSNICKSSVIAK